MESKGLGDSIAKVTKATGVDKFANQVAKGLNVSGGCGCEKRQAYLNRIFPYKNK
jgi:hypothetical protein